MLIWILLMGCGDKEENQTHLYCNNDLNENKIDEDGDCDGILTEDDCNDEDVSSTIISDDADCDGIITEEDCDDDDDSSTALSIDGDCDGTPTEEDCDDTDPNSNIVMEDGDCDGNLVADDCDDNDAQSLTIATDGDCDGSPTTEDCDDQNPAINPEATDTLMQDLDCVEGLESNEITRANVIFVPPNGEFGLLGYAVANAGDVDGDGLGDVLVSSNEKGTENITGEVYLFLGSSLAQMGTGMETLEVSNADIIFYSDAVTGFYEGEQAGTSLASAGDVDGDGLDDILIGAPNFDEDESDRSFLGKVYLILGSSLQGVSGDVPLSSSDYGFVGKMSSDSLGDSVASAGDVDGDGLDDILIGATGVDGQFYNSGGAYLILGSHLSTFGGDHMDIDISLADQYFIGEDTGDNVGVSVAGAGDIDGDGLDDILIGAYQYFGSNNSMGKTYLFYGSNLTYEDTNIGTADHIFMGQDGDFSGGSVAGGGDIDGDGLDDILIGASLALQDEVQVGKVYLLLGSSVIHHDTLVELTQADVRIIGEEISGLLGWAVSYAGDIDGDSLDDIMVSAPGISDNSGKIYLVVSSQLTSSEFNISSAYRSFIGEDGFTGESITSIDDIDGDGVHEFLIGAPWHTGAGERSGEAYLIMSGP
jgi:hypothetical protein